ncbi:MAG: 30S ribosomal protein S9 [Ignavibacteriae bacterium]|nr:30S ribosomal protein S9 [Ignavibacteriota bacterium]
MIHHGHQVITTGSRKTSTARVMLRHGSGSVKVNDKVLEHYFPVDTQRTEVLSPLTVTETTGKYDVVVNVMGGGLSGQAGAVKLALARALVEMDSDLKSKLRTNGMLTRDSRMVERKKYGQRKARKRFQFSKR